MQRSKLTKLLKTLSNKEVKKFRLFLSSSFHNENQLVIQLFDLLEEACIFLKGEPPSKHYLWEKLFPNKAYNDSQFRRLSSTLNQLMEKFLALSGYNQNTTSQYSYLLSAVNERDLDKHFNYSLLLARKNLEKESHQDAKFYLEQYHIESEYSKYLAKKKHRSGKTNLQETVNALDNFYLINKLKYYCDILNYKNVVSIDEDILLMEEIIQHVKANDYEHVPAIAIYYRALMTLTESDNESHFSKLKQLLTTHVNKFSKEEGLEMFTFAINFCIRKINSGEKGYLKEIFNIYKILLDKEILLVKKHLSPWDYKNIVETGLRLKEYTWVESFINEYKKKITIEHRENAATYNLARFYFEKKDYNEVLDLLQQVEYDDLFYGVDSRAILLKTYYELDEREALFALIDSFTIFLQRNKLISEQHKKSYLNRIKFVRKLLKLNKGEKKKIEGLKAQLENNKNVADANWLIEKLKELS